MAVYIHMKSSKLLSVLRMFVCRVRTRSCHCISCLVNNRTRNMKSLFDMSMICYVAMGVDDCHLMKCLFNEFASFITKCLLK